MIPRHLREIHHKHVGLVVDGRKVEPIKARNAKWKLLSPQGVPWAEFREVWQVCKYCRRVWMNMYPLHDCPRGESEEEEGMGEEKEGRDINVPV